MENMDQNQLFTTMFKDDAEGQKLILVPGADELMTQFEQKFLSIVHTMFEVGLKVEDWCYFGSERRIICLLFLRKKKSEITKSKISGPVLTKLKTKTHVELR